MKETLIISAQEKIAIPVAQISYFSLEAVGDQVELFACQILPDSTQKVSLGVFSGASQAKGYLVDWWSDAQTMGTRTIEV